VLYTAAMIPVKPLPSELGDILASSFFIRFSGNGRRSGRIRTTETTYVWDGAQTLHVSGYPGRRDWVANLSAEPSITVHTVEGSVGYDISATARVLSLRNERVPHLLAFINRWATRPGARHPLLGLLVRAIVYNRRLHLPWWGPFYLVRRILDRMPCVEIVLTGTPVRRTEIRY
jgi:hypothetical protein